MNQFKTAIIIILGFIFSQSHAAKVTGAVEWDSTKIFQNTPVGGLSGIVYSQKTGTYFAISDDRGDFGPTRLYELKIELAPFKVQILKQLKLLPNKKNRFPKGKIDFEGITILPNDNFLISSEGDNRNNSILNPSLYEFSPYGKLLKTIPIPSHFNFGTKKGIRFNKGFESLTSHKASDTVLTAIESPLLQDHPEDIKVNEKVFVRFIEYKNKKIVSEYKYPIIIRPGESDNNGLVDLALTDSSNGYSLERSFDRKSKKQTVKIFKIVLDRKKEMISKELFIDLKNLLGQVPSFKKLDNFEGICLGPMTKGKQTVLLVTDNNFNKKQKTQIVAIEL